MWRGEPTPESMIHELSKQLETKREEIDQQLGKVLLRDRSETMKALVQTYGLGNVAVSPFALYLVTHLNRRAHVAGRANSRVDDPRAFEAIGNKEGGDRPATREGSAP